MTEVASYERGGDSVWEDSMGYDGSRFRIVKTADSGRFSRTRMSLDPPER